ncbi:MAG: hypothetical protein ABI972_04505 [Acidobacteriota bacterium]
MKHGVLSDGINIAKIPVAAGAAGAIFGAGSMAILLIGIPELQVLFPAALLLGCGIALALRVLRREPRRN